MKKLKLGVIDKNGVLENIILFFIFLFSLNFMNKSNYLLLICFIFTLLYGYISKKKIYITIEFLILTICFTAYFIIYQYFFQISLQSFITFWFGPILGYFIGYIMVSSVNCFKLTYRIIFSIVLGTFLHGVLNMAFFVNLKVGEARVVTDIWLKSPIAATLQNIFFVMFISLLFYAFFICKKYYIKITLFIGTIFIIISTINTASRTILYIASIVFIINICLYVYLNKSQKKKVLKIIFFTSVLIIIFIIFYKNNMFNIKTWYENSALALRFKSSEIDSANDPRFKAQLEVIKNMLIYPMGGGKINLSIGYAHNLWLDVIRVGGLIPGVLLIMYTIGTIKTLIRFLKSKSIQNNIKYIILSIYFGLTLNFMTEPILDGVPYMFVMMCILNGVTKKVLELRSC